MDDLVGANLYSHIQDTCFSLSMECYPWHLWWHYWTTDNGRKAHLFSSFSFQASVCEHFSGADFMMKEWMVMFFRLYPAPHPPPSPNKLSASQLSPQTWGHLIKTFCFKMLSINKLKWLPMAFIYWLINNYYFNFFFPSQHQSSMREYSSCLVARGLIFNKSKTSGVGRGWRPLHKPQWFEISKKVTLLNYQHPRNAYLVLLSLLKSM